MKYLCKEKYSEFDSNSIESESEANVENAYEYDYDSIINFDDKSNKSPNSNSRKKIGHVKSADKILHLVNFDDKDAAQTPSSTKKRTDSPTNITDTDNTTFHDDSLQTPKPVHKKKRLKNQRKRPNNKKPQKKIDDDSDTVVVSISPAPTKPTTPPKQKYHFPKKNWYPSRGPQIDSSDEPNSHKKYPRVKKNWKHRLNLSVSSDSDSFTPPLFFDGDDMISSAVLYDTDDSISFFGLDSSDSW